MTLELLWNGIVHYRRPLNHKDIEEWNELVKTNPLYTIKKKITK